MSMSPLQVLAPSKVPPKPAAVSGKAVMTEIVDTEVIEKTVVSVEVQSDTKPAAAPAEDGPVCAKKATCGKATCMKQGCSCAKKSDGWSMSSGWGFLAILILFFIIFVVLFWLIFYSLKPSFVLNSQGQVDSAKVLLASVIAALILTIVLWLIKAAVGRW